MNRSIQTLYEELGARVMSHLLQECYEPTQAIRVRTREPKPKIDGNVKVKRYHVATLDDEALTLKDLIGKGVSCANDETQNFWLVDRVSKKGNLVTRKRFPPNQGKARIIDPSSISSVIDVSP